MESKPHNPDDLGAIPQSTNAADVPGYEASDVRGRGALIFAIFFLASLAVVLAIGIAVLSFLSHRQDAADRITHPQHPLSAIMPLTPPNPRLEPEPSNELLPREDLENVRTREQSLIGEKALSWVDSGHNFARIPLADAIELAVKNGLPTTLPATQPTTRGFMPPTSAPWSGGRAMTSQFEIIPPQASQGAASVDSLTLFLLLVSLFFAALICALIVFFVLRYRRRQSDEPPPAGIGSIGLEITWTVIPLALTGVMFAWGAHVFIVAKRPPPNAMAIFVVGKQWMWKIQHIEGRREINQLHVPLGRPVKLVMTSQDVIHDFGLPAFRVKQDVLPNIYTIEWFTPTMLGEFHLFCDQYCGAKHAEMVGTVIVCTPAQYQSWLAGAPADVPAAIAGEQLFRQYGCATCHGQFAPTLAGLFGSPVDVIDSDGMRKTLTADEAYIRRSILDPSSQLVVGYPNRMPTFNTSLSEEQVMDLVQFIKSLGGSAQIGPYKGPAVGPSTQPGETQPKIGNPPFINSPGNP